MTETAAQSRRRQAEIGNRVSSNNSHRQDLRRDDPHRDPSEPRKSVVRGVQLMDKAAFLDFVVEIVRRIDDEPGFKVLPRRWVVERTFGWLVRWRRLVRDYEQRLDVSEAMIHVAMGSRLLRRISH
jgi:transposase